MQTPPEIIFHEVERSEWLESYVLERAARLEKFGEGITRCHVTISREVSSHKKGNVYSVLVEVRIPPQHDLAVKKQKEVHDMHKQLPAAINLAFGAMERHLKKKVEKRRNDEKSHLDGEQPHGMVERIFPEGYGFIRAVDDARQFYFHRNSVLHDDFERLAVGTEVRFTPSEGEQGPQASTVQVVSKPGVASESGASTAGS